MIQALTILLLSINTLLVYLVIGKQRERIKNLEAIQALQRERILQHDKNINVNTRAISNIECGRLTEIAEDALKEEFND